MDFQEFLISLGFFATSQGGKFSQNASNCSFCKPSISFQSGFGLLFQCTQMNGVAVCHLKQIFLLCYNFCYENVSYRRKVVNVEGGVVGSEERIGER